MTRNSVYFFVVMTTLSLFILYFFFLEGKKNRERESNGEKNARGFVSSNRLQDQVRNLVTKGNGKLWG